MDVTIQTTDKTTVLPEIKLPNLNLNLPKNKSDFETHRHVETELAKAFQTTKKYAGFKNVFIANSGEADSMGDVVDMEGMDLERYNMNGVVFYQHAGYYSSNPDAVIANGQVWVEGKRLMLGINAWDTTDYAQEVKRKVDEDFIVAASIGFLAKEWHYDEKAELYYITKSELLEVSVVNVPADPKAVKVKAISTNPPEPNSTATETEKRKVENYLLIQRSRL